MKTFKEAVSQTISFVLILSLMLPVSGWAQPVEPESNELTAVKEISAASAPAKRPARRRAVAAFNARRAAKGPVAPTSLTPASPLSPPFPDPSPSPEPTAAPADNAIPSDEKSRGPLSGPGSVVPILPVTSPPPAAVPVNPIPAAPILPEPTPLSAPTAPPAEARSPIVFQVPVLRAGDVMNGKASMEIQTQWITGLSMNEPFLVEILYKRASDTDYQKQFMTFFRIDPVLGMDFKVNLENLDPETVYDFRIVIRDFAGNEVASLDRHPRLNVPLTFKTNRQREEPDPTIVFQAAPVIRNGTMFIQFNTQWMLGIDIARHRVMIRYRLDDSEEPESSQMMSPLRTDPLLGSDFGATLLVGNTMPGMPGLRSGRTYRFRIVVEDLMSGSIVASLDRDPASGRPLTFTTYTD